MEVFTIVEDALAIIRLPKGVYKQTKVYHRGNRVFVPAGGGFVRVVAKFGDSWGTSHPDIRVTDFSEEMASALWTGEPCYPPSLTGNRKAKS